VPISGWGQRTQAYKTFRIGSYPPWLVLLSGQEDHGEFQAAYNSLDDVCLTSGYRTDDLSERLRLKAVQETRDNFARTPEPAPPLARKTSSARCIRGCQRNSRRRTRERPSAHTRCIPARLTGFLLPREPVMRISGKCPVGKHPPGGECTRGIKGYCPWWQAVTCGITLPHDPVTRMDDPPVSSVASPEGHSR
jgi:hypothetical protein